MDVDAGMRERRGKARDISHYIIFKTATSEVQLSGNELKSTKTTNISTTTANDYDDIRNNRERIERREIVGVDR